jgi:hypothetical protein
MRRSVHAGTISTAETDVSKDTARRIYNRRERYLPREEVRTNG